MKCPSCGVDNIAGIDSCDVCHASLTDIPALQPKGGMQKKIMEGTLSDLCPRRALQVSPADPLKAAGEAMQKARIGCVLVVEDGLLVGILSERDLLLKTDLKTDLGRGPVRDVMRANPTCLREEDEVALAFHRMALSGHLHVPVKLKDGSLGVVSARDLLRYLCK